MSIRTRLLVVAAITFSAGACDSGPDEAQIGAASGNSDWLAEAKATPEFRQACARDADCVASQEPWFGNTETIWRVAISRDADGAIDIDSVESVEVSEGEGVPIGPATGDFVLVGVSNDGTVIDGQIVRFPRVRRHHVVDLNVPAEEFDLKGLPTSTIAYLRAAPELKAIQVRDETGIVQSESVVPASAAVGRNFPALISSAVAQTTFTPSGPPAHCAHIMILNGEEDRAYAGSLAVENVFPLQRPGPNQLTAIFSALHKATRLLCQSISRIALAYAPDVEEYSVGAVLQTMSEGDLITLNTAVFDETELADAGKRSSMERTLLHEAGHTAEAMLNASGNSPGLYSGMWTEQSRVLAELTIKQVRLRKGFGVEWRRVHESFMSHGWASGYSESGLLTSSYADLSPAEVTSGGFMSRYGSNIWWDDIADFVRYPYFSSQVTSDLGCEAMQAYPDRNVPAGLAAVYTKLLFLRDLGLVKASDVETCRGNVGLDIAGPGVHFWSGSTYRRSFTSDLKATIDQESLGNYVFVLTATGESDFGGTNYKTELRLRLDLGNTFESIENVPWPRGIYELGLVGDNNLQVRLVGAAAGNFDAMDGFVLVAEASNSRIAGSIVLQRAFRLSAPLPVPQTFDPPLTIRFLIE